MAARRKRLARIRVLVAFNGMRTGDEADTEVDIRVQSWINAGLVEVVEGGQDPTGPGGAEQDTAGGEQAEGGDGSASGGGES